MAGVRIEIYRTGNGTVTWSYGGAGTLGNLVCAAFVANKPVLSRSVTGGTYNETGTINLGQSGDTGSVSFSATCQEFSGVPGQFAPTARASGMMGSESNSAAAQG